MKPLVLIKLGGSLITDKTKPYTAKPRVMRRLGREIKNALDHNRRLQIIITHGGGSFAHISAKKYDTGNGFKDAHGRLGACITHHDAARINRLVIEQFLAAGLPVASISPSSIFVARQNQLAKKFFDSLINLLNQNITPVLYGDVIWDQVKGCSIYSGEISMGLITQYLLRQKQPIKQIIQCSIENGVYRLNDKKTIPFITNQTFKQIKPDLLGSHGVDVTGGMLHKVEESLKLTEKRVSTLIINGRQKNCLYKALLGHHVPGTLIK